MSASTISISNSRTGGTTLAAPDFVNGGKQLGLEASLIWTPIDYLRFMAQYGHGAYRGGPRATAIDPASTTPADRRSYGDDTMALRAQLEF